MHFITFEGCDGSGKTTQAALLLQYLEKQDVLCISSKEPGGTPFANQIRRLLLDSEVHDPKTEFALLTSARRDHVLNLIEPALQQDITVICDRFLDSSLVYQGLRKGLDLNMMLTIHQQLVGNIMPTLTFLLDLEPETSIKRLLDNDRELNHYDIKPIEFHREIRDGFLTVSKRFRERFVVINAEQEEEMIAQEIQTHINKLFGI